MLPGATFDYGGESEMLPRCYWYLLKYKGKTTGAYYNARENYQSNIWGGLDYQAIINTVAILNY